jgi:hypothetical protein
LYILARFPGAACCYPWVYCFAHPASILILTRSHSIPLLSHHTAEQEDQRRTRSLSQLNLPGGAAGRRNTGSVLLNSGDGMDTEKEIQAASERRRTTARWVVPYNVWNLPGFGSVTTHTDLLPLLLQPSTIICFVCASVSQLALTHDAPHLTLQEPTHLAGAVPVQLAGRPGAHTAAGPWHVRIGVSVPANPLGPHGTYCALCVLGAVKRLLLTWVMRSVASYERVRMKVRTCMVTQRGKLCCLQQ